MPPPESAPVLQSTTALSSDSLDRVGFGLGILFGLLTLLVGLPKALLVLACGMGGAVLGGLLSRRRMLLRWLVEAAQRVS